ncbi:hypothetical protein [Microbacterium excoecariae]|uniref:hypothetical protein n=1 Tax=Microbacterium excoecariae TaxID=2715210 RepID=UPI00140E4978|nr:hypothetical protein [Microbacterium excoecariae]NHI16040.1 hypothetical protein [Microbacterium excoecariae]
MRAVRRAMSGAAAIAAACALAACGGVAAPGTVVAGSVATVAWEGPLTTLNPAVAAERTAGDLDVAALTRARFATVESGALVANEDFGQVTIEEESAGGLVVSYDLAEPVWSDGIALDAADLMLAWAAGSGGLRAATDVEFAAADTGLALSEEVPAYDEFARRIEVTYTEPVIDWQTAIDVAVPAHVVGQRALGIDDPMAAKTAVIEAITGRDAAALEQIAQLWNEGFAVTGKGGLVAADELTLSSGPYAIDVIQGGPDEEGQKVTLVANPRYTGTRTPAYETLVLQRDAEEDPTDLGDAYDVMTVRPTDENFDAIRTLERTDHGVSITDRGELWTLLARVDGVSKLSDPAVRAVFLRAFDRTDVTSAAAGAWEDAYPAASAVLFAPGDEGYDIAQEDAGFADAFRRTGEPAEERIAAGIPENSAVCVLYDSTSAFATAAFEALRAQVAEAGWAAADCGNPDPASVVEVGGEWDVQITRLAIPATPAEIDAVWGTGGALNATGATSDARDALIDELAHTTDPYAARDTRVAIEKTIVDQMVAVPLAMDPIVALADTSLEAVLPRGGRVAPVLGTAVDWRPAGAPEPAPTEESGEDGSLF